MGEIMRWRLARSAQRRIPADVSLLPLDGGGFRISAATFKRLQGMQNSARSPAYAAYAQILTAVASLEDYLTTGPGLVHLGRGAGRRVLTPRLALLGAPQSPSAIPAAVAQAFVALLTLDRWLASQGDEPALADLTTEVDTLLSAVLGTATWTTVHTVLQEVFYAALIISAYGGALGNVLPLAEPLGWLCRLLLVVGLVDLLEGHGVVADASGHLLGAALAYPSAAGCDHGDAGGLAQPQFGRIGAQAGLCRPVYNPRGVGSV